LENKQNTGREEHKGQGERKKTARYAGGADPKTNNFPGTLTGIKSAAEVVRRSPPERSRANRLCAKEPSEEKKEAKALEGIASRNEKYAKRKRAVQKKTTDLTMTRCPLRRVMAPKHERVRKVGGHGPAPQYEYRGG